MDKCAPKKRILSKKEDGPSFVTCYTKHLLKEIANAEGIRLTGEENKKEIYEKVKKRMGPCDPCWIREVYRKRERMNKEIVDDIMYYTFIPIGPLDNEWLTNKNIDEVLKQYEKIFKNYKHLGAVPIDFETVDVKKHPKEWKVTISNIVNTDKERLSMIINTDTSKGPGLHWTALYIDKRNPKSMEYFDSTGNYPPDRLKKFLKKIKKIYPDMRIFVNKTKHQQANSECGVYAINYIVNRLLGKTQSAIEKNIIRDNEMQKRRALYFRSNNF